MGFGGVSIPDLAVITTLLQGQPQDPNHPGENSGEEQNREAGACQGQALIP